MSKLTSFIFGALVGAGAAMLAAPKTGEQTRALVAEKANAVLGEAKDFGAGMPGSAQDLYNTALKKGSEILKDAPGKAQELVGSVSTKGQDAVRSVAGDANKDEADELRAKIEAARQRIAAQVMENAEQNKAVDVPAHAKAEGEAVPAV